MKLHTNGKTIRLVTAWEQIDYVKDTDDVVVHYGAEHAPYALWTDARGSAQTLGTLTDVQLGALQNGGFVLRATDGYDSRLGDRVVFATEHEAWASARAIWGQQDTPVEEWLYVEPVRAADADNADDADAADDADDADDADNADNADNADDSREWILSEDGETYATIEAASVEEALDNARGNVDPGNYSESDSTFWVRVDVRCDATGESGSDLVACDPEEPGCTEREHDWQSPHEIVGGHVENPGVQGNLGGVIIEEVCMHCGCARITNTWAQDPDTGKQGLESVSYEPKKYIDEVRELAQQDD